jgi:hypothetical protein
LNLMNTPGQGSHNRQEDDLYKAKTSYPYVDVVGQV